MGICLYYLSPFMTVVHFPFESNSLMSLLVVISHKRNHNCLDATPCQLVHAVYILSQTSRQNVKRQGKSLFVPHGLTWTSPM